MKIKPPKTAMMILALAASSMSAQAMQKDTIYSMPADADHSIFQP